MHRFVRFRSSGLRHQDAQSACSLPVALRPRERKGIAGKMHLAGQPQVLQHLDQVTVQSDARTGGLVPEFMAQACGDDRAVELIALKDHQILLHFRYFSVREAIEDEVVA